LPSAGPRYVSPSEVAEGKKSALTQHLAVGGGLVMTNDKSQTVQSLHGATFRTYTPLKTFSSTDRTRLTVCIIIKSTPQLIAIAVGYLVY